MKNSKLIGISGKKRHGKDTVAHIIAAILQEKKGLFYERVAFGTAVKQIASMMTGIPADQWETTEQKDTYLGPEWDKVDENGNVVRMTRRVFMTTLGTNAVTAHLHKMAWINMTFRDYTENTLRIVSDVRFFTELERILKHKGITIRVVNPRIVSDDTHPSEVELDSYTEWDYVIINDGNLMDLYDKVWFVLEQIGLI